MNTGISLSVCRDVRRMPLLAHTSHNDESSKHLREVVIGQGLFGRRCYYCDFAFGASDIYEVHHIDGDHHNEHQSNCVPICEMCHAPFHIDMATRKWPEDSGKIIFFPELSQSELNNLLQAIFYAMAVQNGGEENESNIKPIIQPHTIYRELLKRTSLVEKGENGDLIRPGLSEPFALSRVLSNMSDEDYANRDELLYGLRYLAPQAHFMNQAQGWNGRECAFSKLDMATWPSLA